MKVRFLGMAIMLGFATTLLAGCGNAPEDDNLQISNPASVYCEENGGVLKIASDESGEYGICEFENGVVCEEWAYYRGECSSEILEEEEEDVDSEELIGLANPAAVYCEENNGVLSISIDDEGNEYEMCVFEDGSQCEERAFFTEECKPGDYSLFE